MIDAVRADHATLHHYDAKYAADRGDGDATLARDFVTRIGFQMLVACRFMRFCHDGGIPLAPRVASRAIRHLYGSDVHWEADLEPGIMLVHGMGLAISKAARVEHGAILFQNVTLGLGTDPVTREVGAPVIERDVVVGAGCTVIGPISVGRGSKVTANCLVRASVPPQSLVEAATPVVTPRGPRGRQGSPPEVES
jgi:serine O-acetyltransferase